MKTFLLAATAATVLMLAAPQAFAADMPMYEAPMIAAVPEVYAYNWTGFYAGVHVGYGWSEMKRVNGRSFGMDGVLGGGQAGYNWQFGMFVLGAEADISGTGIEGSRGNGAGTQVTSTLDYFGTFRGRAGVAFDRFLVYGTGGLAYGGIETKVRNGGVSSSDSQTQVGWTAGGGVEMMITPNWTARVEYLYADLGEKTYDFNNVGRNQARLDYTQSLVRAGVNYKF